MFKEHWTSRLRESLSNISLKYSSIHSARSSLRRPSEELDEARLPAKEISAVSSTIEESMVHMPKEEDEVAAENYYEYTDNVNFKSNWTNQSAKYHTLCKLLRAFVPPIHHVLLGWLVPTPWVCLRKIVHWSKLTLIVKYRLRYGLVTVRHGFGDAHAGQGALL